MIFLKILSKKERGMVTKKNEPPHSNSVAKFVCNKFAAEEQAIQTE